MIECLQSICINSLAELRIELNWSCGGINQTQQLIIHFIHSWNQSANSIFGNWIERLIPLADCCLLNLRINSLLALFQLISDSRHWIKIIWNQRQASINELIIRKLLNDWMPVVLNLPVWINFSLNSNF